MQTNNYYEHKYRCMHAYLTYISFIKITYSVESSSDCGGNITNQEYGIIHSPHWPDKYAGPDREAGAFSCNWFIHVRPYHKVLLWLQSFSVEGHPTGNVS